MVSMALIHITSMVVHVAIIGCGILVCSTMGVGKYVAVTSVALFG
jgi:hypothetical protein